MYPVIYTVPQVLCTVVYRKIKMNMGSEVHCELLKCTMYNVPCTLYVHVNCTVYIWSELNTCDEDCMPVKLYFVHVNCTVYLRCLFTVCMRSCKVYCVHICVLCEYQCTLYILVYCVLVHCTVFQCSCFRWFFLQSDLLPPP